MVTPVCNSIIASNKNVVRFSFKDDNFPPLASHALPDHCSVGNNVGNPSSNIIKPVPTKKSDVRRTPGTSNAVILLLVFVTLTSVIIVALWHLVIKISTSMFNMLVFRLVVDLAAILVFITV